MTMEGVLPGGFGSKVPKRMGDDMTALEGTEERRLWADYYEATARTLEIMRWEGTDGSALPKIVEQDAKAAAAIKRIKEIRGIEG
jgi:hypothetical protein